MSLKKNRRKKLKYDSHNETILVRDLNEYSKIVELYHFKIEEKKEENLEYIAKCLNIKMEEIDESQACHLSDGTHNLFADASEFQRFHIPSWLTIDKAREIYEELKNTLREELQNLAISGISIDDSQRFNRSNSFGVSEIMKIVVLYKIQDLLFLKYGVEEEHIKKVFYIHDEE